MYDISILECMGVSVTVCAGFFRCDGSFCCLEKADSKKFWTVKLKESSYLMFVIFTDFQHANLYPFQNLSHGFIVKNRILKI